MTMETLVNDGEGLFVDVPVLSPLSDEDILAYQERGWTLSNDPWHGEAQKLETDTASTPVLRYFFKKVHEPVVIPGNPEG